MTEPKELALALVRGLDGRKGQDIRMLGTAELTTMADYFVLCTATSNTHVRALSEAAEEAAEKLGETPNHIEGRHGGTWVLLDFSSVVVHVFLKETRDFYNLERLWSDAEEIDLTGVLEEKSE